MTQQQQHGVAQSPGVCPTCGGDLKLVGSENGESNYKCGSCRRSPRGTPIPIRFNREYWQRRSELIGRIKVGIDEWETTNWEGLRADVLEFVKNFDIARKDIFFKIGHIACLTSGFHSMDNERYKECKQLFKTTEKVYRQYCKERQTEMNDAIINLAAHPDSPDPHDTDDGITYVEYEEFRNMYKHCVNEYRSEKLLWRLAFSVARIFNPLRCCT